MILQKYTAAMCVRAYRKKADPNYADEHSRPIVCISL